MQLSSSFLLSSTYVGGEDGIDRTIGGFPCEHELMVVPEQYHREEVHVPFSCGLEAK